MRRFARIRAPDRLAPAANRYAALRKRVCRRPSSSGRGGLREARPGSDGFRAPAAARFRGRVGAIDGVGGAVPGLAGGVIALLEHLLDTPGDGAGRLTFFGGAARRAPGPSGRPSSTRTCCLSSHGPIRSVFRLRSSVLGRAGAAPVCRQAVLRGAVALANDSPAGKYAASPEESRPSGKSPASKSPRTFRSSLRILW